MSYSEKLLEKIVDVLMISETKFDLSFPEAQLSMESYSKPYQLRRVAMWVCITASGNILASGNISLKLFMAPFRNNRTINLLIRRG